VNGEVLQLEELYACLYGAGGGFWQRWNN
jgi:hypothetical protein